MSTTFGIVNNKGEVFEIAFRGNNSGISWLNNLYLLEDALKDDYLVEALDNSPQGIYTIGDIKANILRQKENT